MRQAEAAVRSGGAHAMTPNAFVHLQRTHGNAAVSQLVVQRWTRADPTKADFSAVKADKIMRPQQLFGLKTGKKTASKVKGSAQQVHGGNRAMTDEENPTKQGQVIKDAAERGAQSLKQGPAKWSDAVASFSTISGIVMGYVGVIRGAIKFVQGILKSVKAWKRRKALDRTRKSAGERLQSGTPSAAPVYAAAEYGFNKVHRFFVETIAQAVMKLAKFISSLINLVTGGTTLVITGTIDLLNGAAKGIMQAYHGIKAIYKERKGTKGVNRMKNAQALIRAARAGDPDAVKLLLKLKPGKKKMQEAGLLYPSTTRELVVWLRRMDTRALDALAADVKLLLRSTSVPKLFGRALAG